MNSGPRLTQMFQKYVIDKICLHNICVTLNFKVQFSRHIYPRKLSFLLIPQWFWKGTVNDFHGLVWHQNLATIQAVPCSISATTKTFKFYPAQFWCRNWREHLSKNGQNSILAIGEFLKFLQFSFIFGKFIFDI